MIVADTNLISYLVVPGPTTPIAERVRAKDRIWVSPNLMRYELLNVVTQHLRRQLLDRDSALKAFHRGLSLVQISPLSSDPLEILNLSQSSGSSPYDLEFVWLAMRLRVPLVTADRAIIEAFPQLVVDLENFGSTK